VTDTPPVDLATAEHVAAARKTALISTRNALRLRLDPRLIVADIAQRALSVAIARVATPGISSKKRKRALVAGAAALATVATMRTWAKRRAAEKSAPVPLAGSPKRR
jgi:hypothetical protein